MTFLAKDERERQSSRSGGDSIAAEDTLLRDSSVTKQSVTAAPSPHRSRSAAPASVCTTTRSCATTKAVGPNPPTTVESLRGPGTISQTRDAVPATTRGAPAASCATY
jgi:hypothetical protein